MIRGLLLITLFISLEIFQNKTILILFPITNRSIDFRLLLLLDWLRVYFFLAVLLISAAVNLFSAYYMETRTIYNRFHLILFSFVLSIILLIFSPNLLRVMIGWDGLGVTSFLLVAYYQNKKSINARHLTIFTNRIGDVLIIGGIALLFNNSFLSLFIVSPSSITYFRLILILIASFTKRAQIPFSAWLPAAIAAPTPVSSLVHSSTLVTAGVYLLIRFLPFIEYFDFHNFLLTIGRLTILIAGFTALFSNDIKKIVAFSTLRQLGLIFLSLRLLEKEITFRHLLIHAFFKALLFIAVGILIHQSDDYQEFTILKFNSFFSNSLLFLRLIRTLSLLGFPFVSGFFSKDLIVEKIIFSRLSSTMTLIIVLGVFLTIIYSWKLFLLQWTFFDSKFSNNFYHKLNPSTFLRIVLLWPLALTRGRLIRWLILPTSGSQLFLRFEIKFSIFTLFSFITLTALILRNKKKTMRIPLWPLRQLWILLLLSSPWVAKSSSLLSKISYKSSENFWTLSLFILLFKNFNLFFLIKRNKTPIIFLLILRIITFTLL